MRWNLRFPVLVVASDGWVQMLDEEESCKWNCIAIKKYNKLQPLVIDSDMQVWKMKKIIPEKPITFIDKILANTFYHPLIPITFELEPILEKPFRRVQEAIKDAIDADDDILTQWVAAEELKESVERTTSFKTLLSILKKKRVI
jgi:hypothetical protein